MKITNKNGRVVADVSIASNPRDYRLYNLVMEASKAPYWDAAVREWEVIGLIMAKVPGTCICGNPHVKHLYTLRNSKTKRTLYPVERSCIRKFGVRDLDRQADALIQLNKLKKKISNNEPLNLKQDFSKLLIWYLDDAGYIDLEDYLFLRIMYNRHRAPTPEQQKEIDTDLEKIAEAIRLLQKKI